MGKRKHTIAATEVFQAPQLPSDEKIHALVEALSKLADHLDATGRVDATAMARIRTVSREYVNPMLSDVWDSRPFVPADRKERVRVWGPPVERPVDSVVLLSSGPLSSEKQEMVDLLAAVQVTLTDLARGRRAPREAVADLQRQTAQLDAVARGGSGDTRDRQTRPATEGRAGPGIKHKEVSLSEFLTEYCEGPLSKSRIASIKDTIQKAARNRKKPARKKIIALPDITRPAGSGQKKYYQPKDLIDRWPNYQAKLSGLPDLKPQQIL